MRKIISQKKRWHSETISNVLKSLDTTREGLSENDAKARLAEFGPNEIRKKESIPKWKILLNQFTGLFVYILIIVAIISYIYGDDKKDAYVIIAVLFINAIIGFYQEFKAEKSIEALKRMASLSTVALRDRKKKVLPTNDIVPGDVIYLEAGDKVPADARLISTNNLEVDESMLTGESYSVVKNTKPVPASAALSDRKNMIFAGTNITKGTCTAVVVATGMATEMGHIARMIQRTEKSETPLQKRLEHFTEILGIGIMFVCAIVFFINFFNSGSIVFSLMTSLALAVAAVPEGLPVIVTICLAFGVQRMIKRNALIRRLPSVETLGCTNVICTDKTGTLTYNQMTVREIYANNEFIEVSGHGYSPEGRFTYKEGKKKGKEVEKKDILTLLTCAALCNNSEHVYKSNKWEIIGDPTEAALVVMAKKAGLDKKDLEKTMPRVSENPFDSERKMMSTINRMNGEQYVFVKGAPDILLESCNRILVNGRDINMTGVMRDNILRQNSKMAKKALRVLACAYKKDTGNAKENELIFLGLIGMIDPPRKEVISAIRKCREAGIKVIMITGDHKDTAIAIGRELGIGTYAVTGDELDRMHDLEESTSMTSDGAVSIVEHTDIYARVQPEHKLKIIRALKAHGHVVAMTGDGVNDAPALKGADIGIAMGITGTDVSKEAADMVLTDDNFTSIVNAVEEGRGIYDNIKKFIKYLVSSNSGEVMTIFMASLLALNINGNRVDILLPIHLLWINLVTDSFLALALGVDPLEKDVMKRSPNKQKESFLDKNTAVDIILTAIVMAAGSIYLFSLYKESHSLAYAQTVALSSLVFFQIFNVFNVRSEKKSIFTNLLTNRWLLLAAAGCIMLQYLVTTSILSGIFRTTSLASYDWIIITAVTSSIIIAIELKKFTVWVLDKTHTHSKKFMLSLMIIFMLITAAYIFTEKSIPKTDAPEKNKDIYEDRIILVNRTIQENSTEKLDIGKYIEDPAAYHKKEINIKGLLLKKEFAFQPNLTTDRYFLTDDFGNEIPLKVPKEKRHLFYYDTYPDKVYNVTGMMINGFDAPEIKVDDIITSERTITKKETIVQEKKVIHVKVA